MFPHTFSLLTTSVWKLVTVFHVLIDTTFVRAATVAINDAVVFSHTHTDPCWGIRPLHHKFRNQSTSQRSRFHPKETRQGNGTPGLQLSHNIQFRSRVVSHQNAHPVRVRQCSRTSPWVPIGQCVAHGNAEFLQTMPGFVLRLVRLILISVLLCLLHHPINFGLRQLPF